MGAQGIELCSYHTAGLNLGRHWNQGSQRQRWCYRTQGASFIYTASNKHLTLPPPPFSPLPPPFSPLPPPFSPLPPPFSPLPPPPPHLVWSGSYRAYWPCGSTRELGSLWPNWSPGKPRGHWTPGNKGSQRKRWHIWCPWGWWEAGNLGDRGCG